ncbi:MAG: FecCD family ABC transporter permease, partial [Gammaproteobacteria bacterium]
MVGMVAKSHAASTQGTARGTSSKKQGRLGSPPWLHVPGRVRPPIAYCLLVILLALAVIFAASTGAFHVAPAQALAIFLKPVVKLGVEFTAQQEVVLWTIRLPRVLLGVLVGAGLALAGAALQGLFRNPLADPGLIGVSGGAALASALVIVMGATWFPGLLKLLGPFILPAAAFGGGLTVTLLVYRLASGEGQTSLDVMLLAGIAINSLVGAGIGVFSYIATDEELRRLTFWSLGSLGGANWKALSGAAPCVLVAAAVLG